MNSKNACMMFPCEFPLKMMGRNDEVFSATVLTVCDKHLQPGGYSVTRRPSSGGKYLSLTVTFIAQSKEQVDAIYRELNDHDVVLMTL